MLSGLCVADMQSGSGVFLVSSPTDYLCKAFTFPSSYTKTPHVQLALRTTKGTYEAAVAWLEEVKASGFSACVTASGPISGNRTITIQWLAYTSVTGGLFAEQQLSTWVAGTECSDVDFASAPNGKVSIGIAAPPMK